MAWADLSLLFYFYFYDREIWVCSGFHFHFYCFFILFYFLLLLFFLSWVFLCILRSPLVCDVCLLYYLMRKNVVGLLYEGEAEKVVLGG